MKHRRLAAIRQLVEQEPVHSQEGLRQRLASLGFVVTQATLSRDIKELGLVKRSSALSRALAEFLLGVDTAQQLAVVKTGPGQAQWLAIAIDRARLTDVVGTLAGDDTILVVCRDARAALSTRATLERLAAEA
jgi:transcriptional regulator of arginine metabolism